MQDEPSTFYVSCQMVIDLTLQCNMDLDGFLRDLSEGIVLFQIMKMLCYIVSVDVP